MRGVEHFAYGFVFAYEDAACGIRRCVAPVYAYAGKARYVFYEGQVAAELGRVGDADAVRAGGDGGAARYLGFFG